MKLLPAASVMNWAFRARYRRKDRCKRFARLGQYPNRLYTFADLSNGSRLLRLRGKDNVYFCVMPAQQEQFYPGRWSRWMRSSSIDPNRMVPSGNCASIEPSE